MQEYTDLGSTPEGLRYFANEMLAYNSEFGGGYAIYVIKTAASVIERLIEENLTLQKALQETKQSLLL